MKQLNITQLTQVSGAGSSSYVYQGVEFEVVCPGVASNCIDEAAHTMLFIHGAEGYKIPTIFWCSPSAIDKAGDCFIESFFDNFEV